MIKAIVTTTIQPPTKATLMYCQRKEWEFYIVGDLKTPHESYKKLQEKHRNVHYIDPSFQEKKYTSVSEAIGWNSIQRRNIGFLEAYHDGAEIVATVDDDNIPYDNWGINLHLNKTIYIDFYTPTAEVFDPLSVTKSNHVWHRGFPIQLVPIRHLVEYSGRVARKVLIQADLWDGDPDIDAIARLTFKPIIKYDISRPYGSSKIAPFNSQNTFLVREVLPYYAVLPHIGRMDDIWGGYILQHYFPNSVVYSQATVYQERNQQDLIVNLENEIIGYRKTLELIRSIDRYETILPENTKKFLHAYQQAFRK